MDKIEKLEQAYNQIDTLISNRVKDSSPDFKAWYTKTERTLIQIYGDGSYEHNSFKELHFSLLVYTFEESESKFIKACADGLKDAKAILKVYLDDLEETKEEEENLAKSEPLLKDFSKVFIVHGHDGEVKEALARLVERQGIKPVILSEQANKGQTIIEKFEDNSDVSCAICLFTADDEGKAEKEKEYNKRARQNVVFEAGYFMGKLGRENVVIIADDSIEIPSDINGIVYANRNNWKFDVLKELRAIGFVIDYNKIDE